MIRESWTRTVQHTVGLSSPSLELRRTYKVLGRIPSVERRNFVHNNLRSSSQVLLCVLSDGKRLQQQICTEKAARPSKRRVIQQQIHMYGEHRASTYNSLHVQVHFKPNNQSSVQIVIPRCLQIAWKEEHLGAAKYIFPSIYLSAQ